MESEIFGHVKGAFTGATQDRSGAASEANGGTLFLDEICEMDLDLQAKLLRLLQTRHLPAGRLQQGREDRPAGGLRHQSRSRARGAAGRFREDLFYRLHVIPVELPALRERGNDLIEIAEALLERFAREEGKDFASFLRGRNCGHPQHGWPGNVRELENAIRNAIVLNDGEELTAVMLPGWVNGSTVTADERRSPRHAGCGPSPATCRIGARRNATAARSGRFGRLSAKPSCTLSKCATAACRAPPHFSRSACRRFTARRPNGKPTAPAALQAHEQPFRFLDLSDPGATSHDQPIHQSSLCRSTAAHAPGRAASLVAFPLPGVRLALGRATVLTVTRADGRDRLLAGRSRRLATAQIRNRHALARRQGKVFRPAAARHSGKADVDGDEIKAVALNDYAVSIPFSDARIMT